ncbi:MAG TPA: hypothetical protein VGQ72_10530 [Pyrinomonadaceae bacterium]|jgi:hypothetical protein|nr:hypothetical protein [Pyrinomonadaceae bacterium]
MPRRLLTFAFISLALTITTSAQWQKKPYKDWSEKEALAVLNNSPWGQTQTYTDTSHMFDEGRAVDSNQRRAVEVPEVRFHIRFFSSKPIRQATSRLVELMQKGQVSQQLATQLDALASADFPDYIIVTVTTEAGQSGSLMGLASSLLDRQSTANLKNDTYLSVKGGKRVYLAEYQAPRKDGLGARFIFPRMVDGKPFITTDTDEVLFFSDLNAGPELSMRFKVKDMMFNGNLEY